MNPMNQLLQRGMQNNPLKSMMNMAMSSGDPMAMIRQMAMQNPKLQEYMQTISRYSSPKQAFYEEARKRGADTNSILNSLK